MTRFAKAAIFVASLAVAAGAQAEDARRPVSLTSFGAAPSLSAYQIAPLGFVAMNAGPSFSFNEFAPSPLAMFTAAPREGFAASMALSPSLALDSGFNTDISQRFGNFDSLKSPLLNRNMLSLANGGAYAGATWMPAAALHLRVGASLRSSGLDSFSFHNALPSTYDTSQSRSLLAGASWDLTDWSAIGLTAIHSDQSGAPFGSSPLGNLSANSRVSTNALDVAARLKLGNNWVTTASADIAGSLTQLDQRAAPALAADTRSYSIAIAKHGLFGDDALGFSFSKPMPGVLENGFDEVAASGDLPPMFVASSRFANQAPETDLQLGYVTQFDNGALALQANAAYQLNYQGQNGATSLSVLSRAKIKF
jgi:hypothetical protein